MWTSWSACVYRLENDLDSSDHGWRAGVHGGARTLGLQGFVSFLLESLLRQREACVPAAAMFMSQVSERDLAQQRDEWSVRSGSWSRRC
jgi:hypothetical protein